MSEKTLSLEFLVHAPEGSKNVAIVSPQMNPTVFGDSSLQDFDEDLLTCMMELTIKSAFNQQKQTAYDVKFKIPQEGILHHGAKFSASLRVR